MTRTRRWLITIAVNVLVGVMLLAVVILGGEIYLRATIPASSNESVYQSTLETRRYKVMKPDARIVAWGSEFRTNKLGFRDRQSEVPAKPASGFRVIVLGDSFTASAGVDFDRLYTTLLENDIRQRVPNAEVLNLSVGGYNIIQYDLVLSEVGLSLQPDLVVVAVFPYNDLSNETYRANFEDASGASKPKPPSSAFRSLYIYRAFLSRVEARLLSWIEPAPETHATVAPAVQNQSPTDAEQNLSALEHIVDTATAHQLPVVIVMLPNTDDFEAQRAEFAPFGALCTAHGWRCLDLLDSFSANGHKPSSMRLNLLDSHPNDLYHARVAKYVGEYLSSVIDTLRANGGSGASEERIDERSHRGATGHYQQTAK